MTEIDSLKAIARKAITLADAFTDWNIVYMDEYTSRDVVADKWNDLWVAWRDVEFSCIDHQKEYGKFND